jgi:ribonuclease BN (tRNA processing enzyme)/HSP20 family molecular chaperone IbpA
VRITVLGKSPSWQDAGGACSGYLVEEEGFALLLDCGNGVFSKLRHYRDYVDVDAVVISHLHADHFLDLVPFSYALVYAPRQQPVAVGGWPGTSSPAHPQLFAPMGAGGVFRHLAACWGDEELIERAFHLAEYQGPDELSLGPITVQFCEVPHYTRTFAVEVAAGGGGRFTYSADCSPNDHLVRFAAGTDLLLIEATVPRPERTGTRGHLTPREAGEHGQRAGARRVVLTHFSDELDAEWARAEAEEALGAPVELAYDGAVYEVPADAAEALAVQPDDASPAPRTPSGARPINLRLEMSERDVFANFDRMRREMDQLFGDVFGMARRRTGFMPAVDVAYTPDPPRAIVTAELAGIDPADIDIEIEGRKLVLSGSRRPAESRTDVYQQVEIERGPFRRVVELGADVRGQEAKALYQDGMLRIELPLVRDFGSHPPHPSKPVPITRSGDGS